jgi:peptidoglycan/LPS O-acetylase OafA/YrhL
MRQTATQPCCLRERRWRAVDLGTHRRVFFPNLDGLRFIAFLIVFLQHGFGETAQKIGNHRSVLAEIKNRAFSAGDVGVSVFFVLSGFLITYLILCEIEWTSKLNVWAFYMRRLLRIWPLYYLTLAFGFWAYPLAKSVLGFSSYVQTGNPLYYIVFLGNFDVIRLAPGTGAMSTNITWSVAIEEQFYLVWPLLLCYTPRRLYKYLFPAIIAASGLYRLLHLHDQRILYFHSMSAVSDLALGGTVAYLSFVAPTFRSMFQMLKRRTIILTYIGGVSMILLDRYLFTNVLACSVQRLVFGLFYAFVILEQNYAEGSLLKLSRLKGVSLLGRYTYGLYLLHPIALTACDVALRLARISTDSITCGILRGFVALAASVALSRVSYHLYEKRFLILKKQFAYIQSG